jgi:glucose-1-phosphate thymidylyltransferase
MKVIIPMAGRGTRLRPQTLVTPKPLLRVAGKTIIEWIVEEIQNSISKKITEIHYVIGDFGKDVEDNLYNISEEINCKGFIHYQREPLGTAHAIYCAKNALNSEVFIAFADTIFKGEIKIDDSIDGIIWTMIVDNPEKYGVVIADNNKVIKGFVEKPKRKVSNNAIVGLYYFKKAEKLKYEIEKMIENDIRENNEYQLTNCLEELKNKGDTLKCDVLEEWLDCGNKNELLKTNKRLVEINGEKNLFGNNVESDEKSALNNCFIDDNVKLYNTKLQNCIVYEGTTIVDSKLENSIIGRNCFIKDIKGEVNIGEYNKINEG